MNKLWTTIMCPRITSLLCFLFLLIAVAVMFGCSSREGDLRLNANDINALNRIYEANSWSFRQSRVGLRVHEGAAVEVEIGGEAEQKGESGGGTLWLPVALLRELPNYFRATEGNDQRPIELEAYKVSGSLWCIMALVPTPSPSAAPTPPLAESSGSATRAHTPLQLRVLMVSPTFESRLNFLVPVGQGRGNVDTTVTLPNNTQFSSLEFGSNNEIATQPTKLTVLPPSVVPEGQVMAATTLSPESSAAWDFSRISYNPKYSTAGFDLRSWSLILPLVIGVLGIGGGTLIGQRLAKRNGIPVSKDEWRKECAQLVREAERELGTSGFDEFTDKFGSRFGDESIKSPRELMRQLEKRKMSKKAIANVLGEFKWFIGERRRDISNQIPQLEDQLLHVEGEGQVSAILLKLDRVRERYDRLAQLESHAEELARFNKRFRDDPKGKIARNSLHAFAVAGLMILFFSLLIAALVHGQTGGIPVQSEPPKRLTTLGELGMSVEPKDAKANSVTVKLDFFPLTDSLEPQGSEDVTVGTGQNNQIEIEDVKVTPPDRIKIAQQSRNQARFTVPANHTEAVKLLRALADVPIEKLRLPNEYTKNLNNSDLVKLEYVIRGAQTVADRTKSGRLHWFPFDTISMEVPLELGQPAVLSKIEVQKPSLDYDGDVRIEGVAGSFIEDGWRYHLNGGAQDSRVSIPAGQKIILIANFQRNPYQRYFLIIGQLLLPVVIGIGLAWFGALRSTPLIRHATPIMAGLGIVTATFFIRNSVYSTIEGLPHFGAGQPPTFFDLIFGISLILCVASIIITSWQVRKRNP